MIEYKKGIMDWSDLYQEMLRRCIRDRGLLCQHEGFKMLGCYIE